MAFLPPVVAARRADQLRHHDDVHSISIGGATPDQFSMVVEADGTLFEGGLANEPHRNRVWELGETDFRRGAGFRPNTVTSFFGVNRPGFAGGSNS